jgi:hypothetical protein
MFQQIFACWASLCNVTGIGLDEVRVLLLEGRIQEEVGDGGVWLLPCLRAGVSTKVATA